MLDLDDDLYWCSKDATQISWLAFLDFPFFLSTAIVIGSHWYKRRHHMHTWERRLCIYDISWMVAAFVCNVIFLLHAKCVGRRLPISTFVWFQTFAVPSFGLRMDFIRSVIAAIVQTSKMMVDALLVFVISIQGPGKLYF